MKSCNVQELETLVEDGWQIIDVREPLEIFEMRAAYNAVNVPLGSLEDEIGKLDASKKYILMCRSGIRSATAWDILEKHNFKHLLNCEGGILAFNDLNKDTQE
jgi:rhodanese-related sulfurtransferase